LCLKNALPIALRQRSQVLTTRACLRKLPSLRHIFAGSRRKSIEPASQPRLRIEKIGFDQCAVSCAELCERLSVTGIIEFQHPRNTDARSPLHLHRVASRDPPNSLGSTRARRFDGSPGRWCGIVHGVAQSLLRAQSLRFLSIRQLSW